MVDLDPNWAFLDCNSSFFFGLFFLKVIRQISRSHVTRSIVDFYPNWAFLDCHFSWIHQWLRNDAKGLKWYRRGALLFLGVIHQISRSHGLKNQRFEFSLSKIIRPVAAIKSLRFALFGVIHQISRSHGLKNRWFDSNLSKITRPVAAIKSLRFALFRLAMIYCLGQKLSTWWT